MIISTHISPQDVGDFWDIAWPYIEDALNKTNTSEYTESMIYEMVKDGEVALFIIIDKETQKVVGAWTMIFHEYPNEKIATIAQLGAEELSHATDSWPKMRAFAEYNGCNRVNIWGRRGWGKALAHLGFKESFTCFERDLTHE